MEATTTQWPQSWLPALSRQAPASILPWAQHGAMRRLVPFSPEMSSSLHLPLERCQCLGEQLLFRGAVCPGTVLGTAGTG